MRADIRINDKGFLILSVDQETIEELEMLVNERTEDSLLADLTEEYSTNGSYTYFNAGLACPAVGLTEAPCFAESMSIDGDGEHTIEGDFWFFNTYMLESTIDILIRDGEVRFHKA